MRIYQQAPGERTGRGNLLEIELPARSAPDDRFYWDAIEGRILVQYKRLRKWHKLPAKEARSVVWTIAFALHMAQPVLGEGAIQFLSPDQQATRRELAALEAPSGEPVSFDEAEASGADGTLRSL